MSKTRRGFLCSAGSLACALAQPARRVPNIVLIVADDLGAMDTTPYGADLHETPNLQRLAAQGIRFTEAHAAAPVCTPTRASIQTGKYPARLNMTIWHEASRNPPRNRKLIPPLTLAELPHSEVTLAELLRERGYMTAHVGKWHLGTASHYPETQGFDINIGGTFWGAPQTFFFPYRGNQRFGGEYRYVPHLEFGEPGEYLTDRLTTEALKVIDHAGARPFFLNLWCHNPHTPIEGKPELVERYRAKLKPGLRHRNATYAAMVHSLDENIGRVLAKLDERGLARDTVVLFTSDNGGYIGRFNGDQVTTNEPLRSGKGSLYQGGIRVPLIVRWPGVTPAGAVCDEPVISNDFFPTIAAITGAKDHGGHDGLSLMPLLDKSASRLPREELYFHYPHYYETTSPVSAVRERNWKLIEYFEDQRAELYDLGADPGESRELSGRHPDIAKRLRESLHQWRKSVSAQIPATNPDYRPSTAPK
ncbi:MAG: sulfatase [Bryobacteraceae bacterium]